MSNHCSQPEKPRQLAKRQTNAPHQKTNPDTVFSNFQTPELTQLAGLQQRADASAAVQKLGVLQLVADQIPEAGPSELGKDPSFQHPIALQPPVPQVDAPLQRVVSRTQGWKWKSDLAPDRVFDTKQQAEAFERSQGEATRSGKPTGGAVRAQEGPRGTDRAQPTVSTTTKADPDRPKKTEGTSPAKPALKPPPKNAKRERIDAALRGRSASAVPVGVGYRGDVSRFYDAGAFSKKPSGYKSEADLDPQLLPDVGGYETIDRKDAPLEQDGKIYRNLSSAQNRRAAFLPAAPKTLSAKDAAVKPDSGAMMSGERGEASETEKKPPESTHGALAGLSGLVIAGGQDSDVLGTGAKYGDDKVRAAFNKDERASRLRYERGMIREARTKGMPVFAYCGGSRTVAEAYGAELRDLFDAEVGAHSKRGTKTLAHGLNIPAGPSIVHGATGERDLAKDVSIDAVNSTHSRTVGTRRTDTGAIIPAGVDMISGSQRPARRAPLVKPSEDDPTHHGDGSARSAVPELAITAWESAPDNKDDRLSGARDAGVPVQDDKTGATVPDAFETSFGAPVISVASHPEAYFGGSGAARSSATKEGTTWADNLRKAFEQSAATYSNRQNVVGAINALNPVSKESGARRDEKLTPSEVAKSSQAGGLLRTLGTGSRAPKGGPHRKPQGRV